MKYYSNTACLRKLTRLLVGFYCIFILSACDSAPNEAEALRIISSSNRTATPICVFPAPMSVYQGARYYVPIEGRFLDQLGLSSLQVFINEGLFTPGVSLVGFPHIDGRSYVEAILTDLGNQLVGRGRTCENPASRFQNDLARIIHQELADVVYPFEISYDFVVEFQNPRIQRPHPP